jgi:bifunctional DNA-binding transcriptional regulator/antitoxin component of YhaV-PrlF toxin-antitoxin module
MIDRTMTETEARVTLGAGSRLVVPAALRKAVGLAVGDEVLIRVEDGELRVTNPRQALARARRLVRRYIPTTEDLTQSLLDDRRDEAAGE